MASAELELIAAMLSQGDLDLIHSGQFTADHCTSNEAKNVCHFLEEYKHITVGQGRVPTRAVVLSRFDGLATLLPEAPNNPDLKALLHEVKVERLRNELNHITLEVGEAGFAIDPLSELKALRGKIDTLLSEVAPEEHLSMDKYIHTIMEDYVHGDIMPQGIPWPWPSMNAATRGMHKGEFIILSGRPKTRKTFVALYVCTMAYMMGYRVLVVTPEMSSRQMLLRSAAMAAAIPYAAFKKGELEMDDLMKLASLVDLHRDIEFGNFDPLSEEDAEEEEEVSHGDPRKMAQAFFKVVKGTNKTVSWIESKVEELKPHLVFVDSFYRLAGSGSRKSDSDHKVLTGISRDLKDMAAEKEIIVLGTHQINREGSKRIGSLDNLAYSDAFGQDADMILRVLTGKKKEGPDVSALVVLGGREAPFDGVLINNEPCHDFSEIGIIEDLKKVIKMVQDEADREDGDDGEEDDEGNEGDEPTTARGKLASSKSAKRRAEKAREKARFTALAANANQNAEDKFIKPLKLKSRINEPDG